VIAENKPLLISIVLGLAKADGAQTAFAGAGSVGLNWITNTTDAHISGNSTVSGPGGVTVKANGGASIYSFAGGVTIGGKATVGAAVAYNYVGGDPDDPASAKVNRVEAYIADSAVTSSAGSISVLAGFDNPATVPSAPANAVGILTLTMPSNQTSQITSVAIGVAAGSEGGKFAAGGSFGINFNRNVIKAYAADTAAAGGLTLSANQSISIQAGNTARIYVGVGGLAYSNGGSTVGAAISTNEITNDIYAAIDGGTATATNGDLTVTAITDARIINVCVGVAASKGNGPFAGAGSIALNWIHGTADAHIAGATSVTAKGPVKVTASDISEIDVGAGGIAINMGGKAAVGAAIAYNYIGGDRDNAAATTVNSAKAYISDSSVTSQTGNIEVLAKGAQKTIAVAIAGSNADNVALSGSFAVNYSKAVTEGGIKVTAPN
jgi:hypothetical protein